MYCSEKCKRKDQAKPPPIPIGPSSFPSTNNWTTPPLTPYGDEFSQGPPRKNYVEPLSPTPPRSVPIEGYPEYAGSRPPISISSGQTSSDGNYHYHYRSGNTSPIDSQPSSPTNNSNIYMPARRPTHLRTLTGGSITSFSGNSSNNPPTQYQLHQHSQRPLPPLHHPVSYSSSPRSIELVTPYLLQNHAPCLERNSSSHGSSSSSSSSEDESQYEKVSTLTTAEVVNHVGSLKTLFNFEAIRGRPTLPRNGSFTPMDRTPDRSPIRGLMRGPPMLMMRSGWPN